MYLLYRDIGIFATTLHRMAQAQSRHYTHSHVVGTTTTATSTSCHYYHNMHGPPDTIHMLKNPIYRLIDELALQLQLAIALVTTAMA